MMFDHVSIGVADLARSRKFYDTVLAALGLSRLHEDGGSLGYGADRIGLWVLAVKSPIRAEPGSGLHLCFVAPDQGAVDRFHAAALGSGGSDNGAPGLRADYGDGYYAAFVVDPDGYRLEAYRQEG